MCCLVGSSSGIVETCTTCTVSSKRQSIHIVNPFVCRECVRQEAVSDSLESDERGHELRQFQRPIPGDYPERLLSWRRTQLMQFLR